MSGPKEETTVFFGLRTTIYAAPELAAQRDWWTSALGVPPYFDQPFYVGFSVGGFELGLDPDGDPARGAQVYWGVEDCEAAVAYLSGLGAEVVTPRRDVGEGIEVALLRAPGGELVGVIRNPHFDPGATG